MKLALHCVYLFWYNVLRLRYKTCLPLLVLLLGSCVVCGIKVVFSGFSWQLLSLFAWFNVDLIVGP
jgi:hypothetical protein